MTKVVEVLDALMGSGKTHAIIGYMSKHQDKPWLYISPILEEVDSRVPERAEELMHKAAVIAELYIKQVGENKLDGNDE